MGRQACRSAGSICRCHRDRARAAKSALAYLDVPTLGQPEAFIQAKDGLFHDAGNIGEGSKAFLQNWMDL